MGSPGALWPWGLGQERAQAQQEPAEEQAQEEPAEEQAQERAGGGAGERQ